MVSKVIRWVKSPREQLYIELIRKMTESQGTPMIKDLKEKEKSKELGRNNN